MLIRFIFVVYAFTVPLVTYTWDPLSWVHKGCFNFGLNVILKYNISIFIFSSHFQVGATGFPCKLGHS